MCTSVLTSCLFVIDTFKNILIKNDINTICVLYLHFQMFYVVFIILVLIHPDIFSGLMSHNCNK